MVTSNWFDQLPVLGKLPPAQAARKLRELGEVEAATLLEAAQDEVTRGRPVQADLKRWWPFQDKPWQHTAHAFGYLAPASTGSGLLPINHAGNITSQPELKNARIKLTLDRLRVADYPGSGTHRILFDFYATHQVKARVEHLHFNATYRVRDGEQAAVIGYPIFVGLNVGTEGVAFKCFTVNVKNEDDGYFLDLLESDVFRTGLKLVSTVQPAVAVVSEMAVGLTKTIAARRKNVPVQDFYLGLDFSNILSRARLAEGTYFAVQIPETLQTVWDWQEWMYNPGNGHLVNSADSRQLIPYNYIVFSVSRYKDQRSGTI
jgi:hypothetical protein